MWLALVLWERRPSAVAAALFGIAGVGVFLTWPVWIGPPVLVLLGLALTRGDFPRATRWRYLAAALGPIALVAALHAAGRGESVAIVQTGGAAFWPSAARFGLPLLLLAVAGTVTALSSGPGRVTVVLLAAVALQGLALFVVARVSGADSPYMALKMPHLAIYPMAALAAVALASVWRVFERVVAAMFGCREPGLRPGVAARRRLCRVDGRAICVRSAAGACHHGKCLSRRPLGARSRADELHRVPRPAGLDVGTGCTKPCSATRCSPRQAWPRPSSSTATRWCAGSPARAFP